MHCVIIILRHFSLHCWRHSVRALGKHKGLYIFRDNFCWKAASGRDLSLSHRKILWCLDLFDGLGGMVCGCMCSAGCLCVYVFSTWSVVYVFSRLCVCVFNRLSVRMRVQQIVCSVCVQQIVRVCVQQIVCRCMCSAYGLQCMCSVDGLCVYVFSRWSQRVHVFSTWSTVCVQQMVSTCVCVQQMVSTCMCSAHGI